MSYQGWYSKKDVLKDLRLAAGKYVHDLDEAAVIVGEQPPPPRSNVPDADAEMQFRRMCGGCKPSAPDRNIDLNKPDLAGITKMLRMVEKVATETSGQKLNVKKNSSTDVIKISKLNPEVEEFIPRSIKISKTISQDKETKNNGTDNCDKFNLNGGRIDTERLTPDEKKIIKEQLKTKISDTSNATCAKVKRERNLAIATLLKLHCLPKPAPVEKEPKLKSPAYFEKCNGVSVEDKSIEKVAVDEKIIKDKMITEEPPKFIEKVAAGKLDNGKIIIGETSTEKPQPKGETDTLNMVLKVQKWLDDSENPNNKAEKKLTKHKSLYLGAVTFKRKAPKPISPSSTESSEYVRPVEDTVFKPSKYSEELTMKYRERCKAREREQTQHMEQNIWATLESQLKAKDEIIKNKQVPQSESS